MKKLSLLPLLLLLSSITFANEQMLVPSDESPYTAICIAAVESDAALSAKMEEFAVAIWDIRALSCNGLSLSRFAAKYRHDSDPANQGRVRVFAFRESISSNETSLCIAAATSNDEYDRLKDELFDNVRSNITSIYCNSMPLRTFARRYGNAAFRI